MNIENNKIGNTPYKSMNNSNLPKEFVLLEQEYQEFKTNIEKSDFANSPQRYMLQRGYEEALKENAQKHLLTEKEAKYSQQLINTEAELEKLGIQIN